MRPFTDILASYQAYALVAFVATVFATPVAMRLAHRFGVLDIPDQKLKPHAKPIPYLGGTAICLGWALALVFCLIRGDAAVHLLLPILLGGVGLTAIGLCDDVIEIPPKLRLGLSALIIAGVLICTGAGFNVIWSASWPVIRLWADDPGAWVAASGMAGLLHGLYWLASLGLGVFIVLGAVNSTNLIDGLDGLCSGVTAIIAGGFFLLASHLAMWGLSDGDPVRLAMSFAMLGAALGFLPFNFNPARIFMGDAGSMLLGFNCGVMILLFDDLAVFRWVLGALMIFALPIFDTTLAMVRRWRAGRSIFAGDRSHFYDQLVQRGLTVRQTVVVSYALTLFYVGVGLLLTWVRLGDDGEPYPVIRTRYAIPLYALIVGLTALVAWWTGLTSPDRRDPALDPPAASTPADED